MARIHPIAPLLLIFVSATVFGCSPLEPLGDEYTGVGTNQGNGFGNERSLIKADTWNLTNISRLPIPGGDVDAIYLDGRVPESVNYESEGAVIKRHRVLDWGQLQLKDNHLFRFIFQYSQFSVRFGKDEGPTALCSADMRGLYSIRDGTVLLYPDRFPTDHLMLQLDARGALRGSEILTTCTGSDNGVQFTSHILLSGLVLNAVTPY